MIVRGGIVPGMLLTDYLGLRKMHFIRIRHWDHTGEKNPRARLRWACGESVEGKKVLLVDDLVDTGKSMLLAKEHLEGKNAEVKTATLIYKKTSEIKPDFFGKKEKEWKWIVFPWNRVEDNTNLGKTKKK